MRRDLIWFIGGMKEATFVARLTEMLLAEHHMGSVLITPFRNTQSKLHSLGYSCLSLVDIFNMVDCTNLDDPALIDSANARLSQLDINMLLHSDQLLSLFVEREVAQSFIARGVLSIYEMLSKSNYAGYLRYGTGSAIGRAMSIVAEAIGMRSYTLASCIGPNSCGLIPAGLEEQWHWTSFIRIWQNCQTLNVSEADRETVDQYAYLYYEWHRALPRTLLREPKPNLFNKPDLLALLRNRVKLHREKEGENNFSKLTRDSILQDANLDVLIPLWESYLRRLKSQWIETYSRFEYDEIPERYIYMPLNFKWDAPHKAWNPMNYLQEYLVTIIASSLPYGYQLVIKEHPYGLGDPKHTELNKFQSMGVKVVKPTTHSLALIRNAATVFCVGDTTGWEAILFKVPLIIFSAKPFYAVYPYLWATSDPNIIHKALREAVQSKNIAYSDDNLWYLFIQSVLESVYRGNIWGYKSILWQDADESEENLKNIARMIVKEGDFLV